MTSVIIHLHGEMVHYGMERAVPGPGAAGSSSGAGLRSRDRAPGCARRLLLCVLPPGLLRGSSAGQEFKSDNQAVILMFDFV